MKKQRTACEKGVALEGRKKRRDSERDAFIRREAFFQE